MVYGLSLLLHARSEIHTWDSFWRMQDAWHIWWELIETLQVDLLMILCRVYKWLWYKAMYSAIHYSWQSPDPFDRSGHVQTLPCVMKFTEPVSTYLHNKMMPDFQLIRKGQINHGIRKMSKCSSRGWGWKSRDVLNDIQPCYIKPTFFTPARPSTVLSPKIQSAVLLPYAVIFQRFGLIRYL